MSKRNIIITCVIITLAVFMVFMYFIVKSYNNNSNINISTEPIGSEDKKIEIDNKNIVSTSNIEEKIISPTAVLEMRQYYKECGHITQEKYVVPEEVVNMTEDEVKEYYYGWDISEFSENKVQIYKENDGLCNEHYIVKDIDGYIVIYNKNKYGEENIIRKTDILTKYLPEEDRLRLKQGVKVVGKQNLEIFLEDFD